MPKLRQVCPGVFRPSVDGVTHTKCQRPWGLDGLTCLWPYGGVIRKAVLGLKYKFATEIAKELSTHTANSLQTKDIILPPESFLVPMPLHWLRGNWRGFNQAELVGQGVAKKMGWSFQPNLLSRKFFRRPQTELKELERKQNVRGVFSLNPDFLSLITSHSLIIFDDVYTTGSTLNEAAKVLKRKGAKRVWGLTIA